MNYYPFHIGDYLSHTMHLSALEDIAYRRCIDFCYLHETALPSDLARIARLVRMQDHLDVVSAVVKEFFSEREDGWHSDRIDREVLAYRRMAEGGKRGAARRWDRAVLHPHPNSPPNGLSIATPSTPHSPPHSPPYSQANANQEPITKNQKPGTKKKDLATQGENSSGTRASRLPNDLELSPDWEAFCRLERPALEPHHVFQVFKDYWIAQSGRNATKLDWFATWRNWVRNQRERQGSQIGNRQQLLEARNQSIGDAWVARKLAEEGQAVDGGQSEGEA